MTTTATICELDVFLASHKIENRVLECLKIRPLKSRDITTLLPFAEDPYSILCSLIYSIKRNVSIEIYIKTFSVR